jgi:hypothetical protein
VSGSTPAPPPGTWPRPRRRLGVIALAGWLFADLLLVLALVSMADRPDPQAAAGRHPKTHSPSPSPTPPPSPTPTGPRSLVRTPEHFAVKGTGKRSLVRQIAKATKPWAGRSAAMVLTFGGSESGTRYAHRVNSYLHEARPDMFDEDTATDDFIRLGRPLNTAEIRLYFYTSHG